MPLAKFALKSLKVGVQPRFKSAETISKIIFFADASANHLPMQEIMQIMYAVRHDKIKLMKRLPLYNVSKLIGHRSLQMTQRYAHLAPDSQKSAAMTLNGILSKANK